MAITSETNHVTWPTAAKTKSVASSGTETSEDYTFDANAFDALLFVKADNSGTPAAGDTIDIYAQIEGDPDDDATDENANQGDLVGRLDTNEDDPAIKPMWYTPVPGATYKFAAKNNGASAITVSIEVRERKSA